MLCKLKSATFLGIIEETYLPLPNMYHLCCFQSGGGWVWCIFILLPMLLLQTHQMQWPGLNGSLKGCFLFSSFSKVSKLNYENVIEMSIERRCESGGWHFQMQGKIKVILLTCCWIKTYLCLMHLKQLSKNILNMQEDMPYSSIRWVKKEKNSQTLAKQTNGTFTLLPFLPLNESYIKNVMKFASWS